MPYSRANGLDIWYETAGAGPPLVFVHANPFDHDLWLYQSAHFSTWFKVIGINIRGYGRSAKVTTPFALRDMLGLDHPDKFDAVILVGGSTGASSRYQSRIDGYRNNLADYHIKHMRELVTAEFSDSARGRFLLNMFVEREPRLVGEAIAQVFMAGNHTDNTGRLATMKVPTLVINGEFDNSLPAGTRTASLSAVHRILPGTGHACCLEDPAGFDRLVIDFLQSRGLMPPVV